MSNQVCDIGAVLRVCGAEEASLASHEREALDVNGVVVFRDALNEDALTEPQALFEESSEARHLSPTIRYLLGV